MWPPSRGWRLIVPCRRRRRATPRRFRFVTPRLSGEFGESVLTRLHWSCGPITPAGWVNSDLHPWPGVHAVADIRAGLPFADGHFDCVVSMHGLPEITY